MSGSRRPPADLDIASGGSYFELTRRPLQILVFLTPLIIAYELCLAFFLSSDDGLRTHTVEAHRQILRFFAMFGVAPTGGLHLGGLVIILVLLAWHLLARDPWRVSWSACLFMGIETLLLAFPLLAVAALLTPSGGGVASAGGVSAFASLDVGSQLAISVGAGLYEELVFRMIAIAVIHTALVDVGKMKHGTGTTIAVVVSAVAFAFYHDLDLPGGGIDVPRLVFLFLAGLYFGVIFTVRGFGIVVGAHAGYDVLTVLLAGE